jgi:hypothetical protein
LPLAPGEWLVADPARNFLIVGLRACWSLHDLIEGKAVLAAEKRNCIGIRHVGTDIPAIASRPAELS